MNKEEIEQTIKGLQENQETAIKLLEENVELKKIIKKARKYVESINGNFWIATSVKKELLKMLEGDNNDN